MFGNVCVCVCVQIGEKFHSYCQDKQNMTFLELQSFLREEQEDPRVEGPRAADPRVEDPTYMNALFRDFTRRSNLRQPSLTLNEVWGGWVWLHYVRVDMICVCILHG